MILGVLYTYFGRKHENNDFAIGLPVLNRNKSAYKKTVGLFMGVSPLRMALDFETTFQDLIIDIRNQLRQDYRHQRLPLGKLIQEIQLHSQKERLFNITLSYEKQDYSTNFKNTQTKVIPLSHQSERVALALYIREFDESEDVKIDFDYNLNYFDNASITQIVNQFEKLIDAVLTNSNKKLKELDYLSEEEKKQILFCFNDTNFNYPKDKTVLDLFEEQVLKNQEKEALKDDYKSYSYSELNKSSNQIAEYLIATYGEQDKSPIGVLLNRSANMVAVLLGILKSGRSYIPLDPTFPKERLCYIVDNSKSKLLISEKEYELEGVEDVVKVSLENILAGIDEFKGNLSTTISPKDTAYIIYTSGSTGDPKGVEIRHQSLLNFLCSIQKKPGVSSNDIFFSVTTYSFDISILEFFAPLISGATLYIASHNVLSDSSLIIEKLEKTQATIIQATPSFYQMLFNADWDGSKGLKVLCGGDLLSEALAEKLLKNCLEVWNMYGPTETTIWSSLKKIEHPKDAANIGKPINNTLFYILDSFLSPKPIGTAGAIYIAGDGLAKGYYKNESLTNDKFIKNPFDATSLLYETGDVGKWNDKGEIEFLGRNDNQVKIRGYRIELGDIESQLNQIEGINDSVVIAKKGDQQDAFLVAYILKSKKAIDIEKIIAALKINLPHYMIPNAIIPLEEFPLTLNQKVDRKSLLQRVVQQNENHDDFKAPISDLEKKLSECWAAVLNTKEPISVNDNFFALGGHSLNAVKLIGLIAKQLSFSITLKTIFDFPTVESLAVYLQEFKLTQSKPLPLSEIKDLYSLTPAQYTIWLASQQIRGSIAYNMSVGYSVEGIVNLNKITKSINRIIEKYEILRTNFIEKEGIPYQKISAAEKVRFEISVHQLKNDTIAEVISRFVNTKFDLEIDLLIRVQLLELKTNQYLLLFSTHHIIMDGLSVEIFIKELIKNYNETATEESISYKNKKDVSFFLGETLTFPEESTSPDALKVNGLKYQFRDYSEWFNKKMKNNAVKNELFWENYLQNFRPKESFYKDFSTEHNQQNGSNYLFELTHDTTTTLKELALENQVTLYTILVAALNVLIFKTTNHDDICIGTVHSGRNILEINNQIGMFIKTLVLRSQIKAEQNFVTILKNTQRNLLEINDYQSIPFAKVSQSVFDVMLVFQNPEFSFENIDKLNDFKLTSYPIDHKFSRLPIVFNLFESDNRLKGIIDYNCDLFEEVTIKIIVQKYSNLLSKINKNPSMKIDLIDIKLELEKNTSFDFDFNF